MTLARRPCLPVRPEVDHFAKVVDGDLERILVGERQRHAREHSFVVAECRRRRAPLVAEPAEIAANEQADGSCAIRTCPSRLRTSSARPPQGSTEWRTTATQRHRRTSDRYRATRVVSRPVACVPRRHALSHVLDPSTPMGSACGLDGTVRVRRGRPWTQPPQRATLPHLRAGRGSTRSLADFYGSPSVA